MNFNIQLGLVEPEQPEQPGDINEQATINGMREAIFKGSFESALIRQCLQSADIAGLNGEDRYTLLAYRALITLERYYKMHMKLINCNPTSPYLLKTEDKAR